MMKYRPIIGTLGFVRSPDRESVLMVHREDWGKYNGLGGKMESGEDVYSCLAREIREEAGIECLEMVLRGTVNWTGFGPSLENWLGFVFLVEAFEGEPWEEGPEGKLGWVELSKIPLLPMWEGDRHFLPMVFDADPRPFHGHMPYDNDRCLGWSFRR